MKPRTALFAAIAGLAFATPVIAQDYYDDGVTVTPPYTVERERGPYGGRVETVRMSRVVSARGLNLRYDSDVNELERRVRYTAQDICEELEDIVRASSTTDRECVRDAVRGAMPQVRTLVYAARY